MNESQINQSHIITHHTFNKNQYLTVPDTGRYFVLKPSEQVPRASGGIFKKLFLLSYLCTVSLFEYILGFTKIQHCHFSGTRMNDHISSLEAHCHHENWKRKPSVATSPTPSIFSTHSVNISGFCSHVITGKRRLG